YRYWCVLRHCIYVCRETEAKHIKVEPFNANHLKKRRKRNASESRRGRRKRGKTRAITNNESTAKAMLEPTTKPIITDSERTTITTEATTITTTTTTAPLTTESRSSTKTSTDSATLIITTSAAVTTTKTNLVTPTLTTLLTIPLLQSVATNPPVQDTNKLVVATKNISATTPTNLSVSKNITPVASINVEFANTTPAPITNAAPKTSSLATIMPETTRQRDTTSTVLETTTINITSSAQALSTIVATNEVSPTTTTELTTAKTSTMVPSTTSTTLLPPTPAFGFPTTITQKLTHAVSPILNTSSTTLATLRTPEVPKIQDTSKTTSESMPGTASTTIMPTTSKLFKQVTSEPTSISSTNSIKGAD
ncbi:unnamed protein product, partial [Staurois parvus]